MQHLLLSKHQYMSLYLRRILCSDYLPEVQILLKQWYVHGIKFFWMPTWFENDEISLRKISFGNAS